MQASMKVAQHMKMTQRGQREDTVRDKQNNGKNTKTSKLIFVSG
jgi:hypothetical protein